MGTRGLPSPRRRGAGRGRPAIPHNPTPLSAPLAPLAPLPLFALAHARLGEGRHLVVGRQRAIDDAQRQRRAGALAQPQIEIQQRGKPQSGRAAPVAALDREMPGDQVRAREWTERHRDQRRRSRDEAIQHDGHAPRRRAQDDADQPRDLQPADLRQHVKPILRIGRIDGEGAFDDRDLVGQLRVVDARAASRHLGGRVIRSAPR